MAVWTFVDLFTLKYRNGNIGNEKGRIINGVNVRSIGAIDERDASLYSSLVESVSLGGCCQLQYFWGDYKGVSWPLCRRPGGIIRIRNKYYNIQSNVQPIKGCWKTLSNRLESGFSLVIMNMCFVTTASHIKIMILQSGIELRMTQFFCFTAIECFTGKHVACYDDHRVCLHCEYIWKTQWNCYACLWDITND